MQIYGYSRCLSLKSVLKVDLCTLFYVADDSEWRRRRQINLRKRTSVRGQKGSASKFRAYAIFSTQCLRIFFTLTTDSFSCYPSYSFSLAGGGYVFFVVVVLFSHFSLPAGFMTHHLPVLLHLQAHICRDRIKQNGSTIKWLWHLSSHTS